MRYLLWALKLALFVLVLLFAVKNTEPVAVRYYLGGEWRAPLVFVLLTFFCAGVAAGIAACLPRLLRQRREIGALRRELQESRRGSPAAEEQAARAVGG
ncbi:MAG TPA: LapA family protein [Burkholderiales bacterium]|nr:LapA family protein [Burkholderiales bacterium]